MLPADARLGPAPGPRSRRWRLAEAPPRRSGWPVKRCRWPASRRFIYSDIGFFCWHITSCLQADPWRIPRGPRFGPLGMTDSTFLPRRPYARASRRQKPASRWPGLPTHGAADVARRRSRIRRRGGWAALPATQVCSAPAPTWRSSRGWCWLGGRWKGAARVVAADVSAKMMRPATPATMHRFADWDGTSTRATRPTVANCCRWVVRPHRFTGTSMGSTRSLAHS